MPARLFLLIPAILVGVSLCLPVFGSLTARAQAPAANAPAPGGAVSDGDQLREVALTDEMIEGVLASQKEFDAIAEKLPETAPDQPDPKVTAQFETVARKHGFASYNAYNDAVDTISLVLGGFDPASKKYVGAEAVIRGQIAAVEADTSMPEDDRKQALEQLNDALKAPAPPVRNQANIDLVAKYYDKLNAVLEQGE